MKKVLIEESERERILEMHYEAMGKSLISEQNPNDPPASGTQTTPPAQAAGTEAQSTTAKVMETQKNAVKNLLLRSPFLMPDEQDFESLKKDVTEVINTLKSPGFDVLKVSWLPKEYFPLYQRMYDVARKWPELNDVPGPWPYTLKGFIQKAASDHNWKQRQGY